MSDDERFAAEVQARIRDNGESEALQRASAAFMTAADAAGYEYNFAWMGRPIIQYPQDVVALQEIVWRTRPDLVVETGVARGGSTILYASLLALLGGDGRVVGVDIDIRPHNRAALLAHPLADRITLVEGSSTDEAVVSRVHDLARGRERVMVCLDSDHSHAHVLAELLAYTPLVRAGGYVVVFDTSIEDLAPGPRYPHRAWGRGDSPRTAVDAFLRRTSRFEIDRSIQDQLLITSAPGGYLKCTKD